jgi:ribosomal protein S18 acetylase RimI-like enzyme
MHMYWICARRMRCLNCSIRKADQQDLEALAKLADQLIRVQDQLERKDILAKILQDPNRGIYVAEVKDMVVGFIEVCVFPDFVEGAPLAVIQNLVVDEKHRGLGIGSRLMNSAVEEAEKQNVAEIHVWTEFDNERALRFYAKHEFTKKAILLERETRKERLNNSQKTGPES